MSTRSRVHGNGPGMPQTLTQLRFISTALSIGTIVTSSMDGGRYGYISTYVVMLCGFLTFAFHGIPPLVARRQGRASSSYYFPVVFCAWLLMALWIGLCGFLAAMTYYALHNKPDNSDELPMQMWLGVTLALAVLEAAVMIAVAVLVEKEWRMIRYPDPTVTVSQFSGQRDA